MAEPTVGRGITGGTSTSTSGVSAESIAAAKKALAKTNTPSQLDALLSKAGIELDSTGITDIKFINTLTNAQLTSIALLLKKRGYTVKADAEDIRRVLSTDPVLIGYVENSDNKYSNLISIMNKTYLPGVDTPAASEAPNLPSRNVYQYKKEDIYTLIDNVYQTTIGRAATEEEKATAYVPLEKQINQGTLSTTKEVFNKETGKKEVVTTQTPAFSEDDAKIKLEKELQKTNPLEYQRRKAFEFSDELNKILAGGA